MWMSTRRNVIHGTTWTHLHCASHSFLPLSPEERVADCTGKPRTHSFRWNIVSRCRFLPTKVEKSNASNLCFTIGCLWFHTRRRMGSREAATTAMVIDWAERPCHAPGQPSVSLNEISGYWLNAVIFNLWSKLLWVLPLLPGFSSRLL